MPGISINCSGVIPASFSTELIPAASIFSMVFAPTPASDVNGVTGAVSAGICSSISWRFSSSLLMSMSQPISLLARRTFCPFLPMASESCESSTITSSFLFSGSVICTRVTFAGLPRRKPDLHRTIINFWHFHFEQALYQARVCARNDHLRPLRRAVHHLDHHAQPFADVVRFQLRLLALRQPRFRAAHVHDQVRALGALHNHRDQLAHARVIFVENRVALGLA